MAKRRNKPIAAAALRFWAQHVDRRHRAGGNSGCVTPPYEGVRDASDYLLNSDIRSFRYFVPNIEK